MPDNILSRKQLTGCYRLEHQYSGYVLFVEEKQIASKRPDNPKTIDDYFDIYWRKAHELDLLELGLSETLTAATAKN